ncbi:MAG: hypothetical protein JWL69_1389 [Phycisphaerales bacterium]|nr:hypothetical protein [Phycisphaerales bacterium]
MGPPILFGFTPSEKDMSKFAFALLAVLCLITVAADEKPANAPPRSSSAVAAMKEYERSIDAAEKACREAKLLAENKLVEKLKPALVAATKAGNLVEANSIERVMKESKSRAEELRLSPEAPKAFKIEAAEDWQPTVEVQQGQEIRIRAAGKWCANITKRKSTTFGPDGSDGSCYLEGRIGDGEAFRIGSSLNFTAKMAGTLEMRMHDSPRDDNDGALDVGIMMGKVAN